MKSFWLLLVCFALPLSSPGQTKNEHPKITGIDHVVIYVSDLKAARDFYATKLGLNENGGGCDDARILNCFTVNWITGQRVILKTSTSCPRTDCLDEVVFQTADARKLRSFLSAHGVAVDQLQKSDNISLSFETQDADGHRVGFTQKVGFPINDPGPGIKVSYGRIIHAGFVVHDRSAEDHRKNGWNGSEKPKIGRDGKWQLNLYDPDDTRVEFMEFTPVQKPCCSDYTGPHPKP